MAGMISVVSSSPVALVERAYGEPFCTNITIPVTISAENFVLPLTSPLTYNLIQGTFNISGRYCEPQAKNPSRTDSLQFLVHGLTYAKNCRRPYPNLSTSSERAKAFGTISSYFSNFDEKKT
jgi:hypothetical protein